MNTPLYELIDLGEFVLTIGYVYGGIQFMRILFMKRDRRPVSLTLYATTIGIWLSTLTVALFYRHWNDLQGVPLVTWVAHAFMWIVWGYDTYQAVLSDRQYKRVVEQRQALDRLSGRDT